MMALPERYAHRTPAWMAIQYSQPQPEARKAFRPSATGSKLARPLPIACPGPSPGPFTKLTLCPFLPLFPAGNAATGPVRKVRPAHLLAQRPVRSKARGRDRGLMVRLCVAITIRRCIVFRQPGFIGR